MANRRNCNRITHLTPAKLIKVNIMITNAATLLSIQGFGSSVGEINPAMDSPNPVAHKALPKFKKKNIPRFVMTYGVFQSVPVYPKILPILGTRYITT